ncbi:MAG: zinc-binding dehydrogenase [Nitrospinae bacterium]|nr:zinc-binding dehydrogenase [Nitrospinota bacterium]
MVLREPGKPFVEEEYPDPVAGPGEAVAKILACGAGLTIHHARMGRVPGVSYPLIIGHEITAVITALGEGVEGLQEGDAVTAHFYVTCGRCKWCLINRETLCENFTGYIGRQVQGAYAEYIKLPARNFIKIPAGLDYEKDAAEVSVICDAIATPYKVTKRARIAPLENVAVIGAGGGVGIHMVMMAKWAHARVIAVDVAANKLGKCRDVGADEAVDASQGDVAGALMDLTGGEGVDVVVDFVSSASTMEAGVQALGTGGRLVTLGGTGQPFQAAARDMVTKELELIGSRYCSKQEIKESLDLVARGDVWPVVTETYAFNVEEVEKVHERLEVAAVTGRAVIVMD